MTISELRPAWGRGAPHHAQFFISHAKFINQKKTNPTPKGK
jgi:hypothetical protein